LGNEQFVRSTFEPVLIIDGLKYPNLLSFDVYRHIRSELPDTYSEDQS
jgi:hypothetical protein